MGLGASLAQAVELLGGDLLELLHRLGEVGLGGVATLIDLNLLHGLVDLAQDGETGLVVRLHGKLDLLEQLFLLHAVLSSLAAG